MIYRFGAFELDEAAGELRRHGRPVAVQPKPLALLQLLVRERARVVPSDEIFETLWPGTAVTAGSLTRAVSHARRAIGDTHRGSLLRSYARRGYRFCGDVVQLDCDGRPAAVAAAAATGEAPPSAPAAGPAPFVGRGDALERLQEAWRGAAAGRGTVALVSGPPGIGKTRLVEVFADSLRHGGPLVLAGRCREGEGVPPFWLWVQILRRLRETEELARDEERALAALLPELPEPAGRGRLAAPPGLSPEQRRFLLLDDVARVLLLCSRRRPLLLVLEDVQWAQAQSLGLLEHLALEMAADRLLVVATVRDAARERGHPLSRALSILSQQEGFTRVALGGLSRGEVAAWLERVLGRAAPADLTSELFARTEGVPLFLREAVRLLEERGDLAEPERIARRGVPLPERALDFVRRGLDALSPACADLVGAASVIGREFAVPFVAAVAKVSREHALDLLDEAVRSGVVEPASAASYRFTHALVQEAAYGALPPGRRARLHHRAARRLERQHGADPDRVIAELAYHHHRGIAAGDPERAYACAVRAAERAEQVLAYERAAAHYEQAVAALDHCEPVDAGRRLETLLCLGTAYRLAGERGRRREVLAQAMEAARALGRPRDFARAAIGFCDLSEWGVRDDPARAALEQALRGVEDDPGVEGVRVATRLAYLSALVSRESAEGLAREAVARARGLGEADAPDALQDALYVLHLVIGGPDGLEEREKILDEMVGAARAARAADPALIAVLDVACDRLSLGDAAGAAARRAQADALAGERPHPGMLWHTQVYDTGLALLAGAFEGVEPRAREALLTGRRIGHPYAMGCSRAHRAMLARERGDAAALADLMAPALAARTGPTHWVKAVVARSFCALGRSDEARALFEEIAARDFDDVPRNLRWAGTVVEIAGLCADLEDRTRAGRLLDVLAPVEHQHGVLPMAICYGGPVSYALARLLAVLGRSDEAASLLGDALEGCAELGARPMHARVLAEYGALLARRRERSRAREALDEAARLAAGLGMAGVESSARATLERV